MTVEKLLADAGWVRRLAAALVNEPADADDVAQLTLVAAIENPPATGSEPRRWLAAVARNVARMMGRRASRRARRETLLATDAAPSPEALVERAELQRQLATLLTEMDEPYRTTVLLCYFEELSPSEIAQRLDLPAGTVRSRLKRGLDQLRSRFEDLNADSRAAWLVPMTALGKTTHSRYFATSPKGLLLMANKTAIAAGIGALAATTLLVAVHEGRVMLAGRRARAELTIGASESQTAQARLASSMAAIAAHLPPPPAGVTREELLKRDAEQRAELVRLRAELNRLLRPDPFPQPIAWKHGEEFINPPKDELIQMAKDCRVRWDQPHLSTPPDTMTDDFALEAGVTDDERHEFDRVAADFTQKMIAQLRVLYIEETGDKSGADSLTADAMMAEIRQKAPVPVAQQAYWQISNERAGLIPASTDTNAASVFERFLRLEQGAGGAFESALGAAIGSARAHALRTQQGSWDTQMSLGSPAGCPPGR